MAIYLLIAAVVIILCIIFNKISNKLGIPMLLAFILLGMFCGSDGIVKIYFDNYGFAEKICSVALIFIIFYGGFGTKWSEAKPVAGKAILLSSAGVVLTAGITGIFCYYVLKIKLLESFLIGAVISSTDAASVFSILRSKRLNLKYNTASLLELESGSNDPFSYMLTVFILSFMGDKSYGSNFVYMIFSQIVYGVLIGIITALAAICVLKRFHFTTEGFNAIFVFAAAIFSYAAPSVIGGNGYLSVYITGIILGNHSIKNKQPLVHFFDGINGLMQMLIFFLLGLLSFPSQIPNVIFPAILIAVFLTFVARPISVFLLLSPLRCKFKQMLFISFAGLRGAASIVFAVIATVSPAYTSNDVFHITFFIVIFSILLQGSLLPLSAKMLDMTDKKADVLKTFNDYTKEVPIQFVQFTISENHPWSNKKTRNIVLPPETLLVLLQRGNEKITPNGDTLLLPGDILVLSAKAPGILNGVNLTELRLDSGSEWVGKELSTIDLEEGKIIIMIMRNDKIVIPKGNTSLEENDILVINES